MTPAMIVAVFFGLLLVALVLAGMLSAAYEIHRERKAGQPVTRPGWDRDRYTGPLRSLRGAVKGLRS